MLKKYIFSVFDLKKSHPFDEVELNYVKKMLAQYSLKREGIWLQILPYTKFEFLWCDKMNGDNGVMGAFSVLFKNKIFLQQYDYNGMPKDSDGSGRISWLEQMFPTIIHELRHAYQWKTNKLLYVICCLPILRQFTLEKDANAKQKECLPFIEKWTKIEDYKYADRHNLLGEDKFEIPPKEEGKN